MVVIFVTCTSDIVKGIVPVTVDAADAEAAIAPTSGRIMLIANKITPPSSAHFLSFIFLLYFKYRFVRRRYHMVLSSELIDPFHLISFLLVSPFSPAQEECNHASDDYYNYGNDYADNCPTNPR